MTLIPKAFGEVAGSTIALPFVRREPADRGDSGKMARTTSLLQVYNRDSNGVALNPAPKPGDHITVDATGERFLITGVKLRMFSTVIDCMVRQEFP